MTGPHEGKKYPADGSRSAGRRCSRYDRHTNGPGAGAGPRV